MPLLFAYEKNRFSRDMAHILNENKTQAEDLSNKMTCVPSEDSDQPGHTGHLVGFLVTRLICGW